MLSRYHGDFILKALIKSQWLGRKKGSCPNMKSTHKRSLINARSEIEPRGQKSLEYWHGDLGMDLKLLKRKWKSTMAIDPLRPTFSALFPSEQCHFEPEIWWLNWQQIVNTRRANLHIINDSLTNNGRRHYDIPPPAAGLLRVNSFIARIFKFWDSFRGFDWRDTECHIPARSHDVFSNVF